MLWDDGGHQEDTWRGVEQGSHIANQRCNFPLLTRQLEFLSHNTCIFFFVVNWTAPFCGWVLKEPKLSCENHDLISSLTTSELRLKHMLLLCQNVTDLNIWFQAQWNQHKAKQTTFDCNKWQEYCNSFLSHLHEMTGNWFSLKNCETDFFFLSHLHRREVRHMVILQANALTLTDKSTPSFLISSNFTVSM